MAIKWGVKQPYMLYVREIVEKVRMKISDSMINKFSDQEIVVAINEAIDILWRALSSRYSTITHKRSEYTLRSGSGELLPDDFYTLVELIQLDKSKVLYEQNDRLRKLYVEPHVDGNYLFGVGNVLLIYNYFPRDVSQLNDVLDIPIALVHDTVSIVVNVILGQLDRAQQSATETANRVSQFREIARPERMVAFP